MTHDLHPPVTPTVDPAECKHRGEWVIGANVNDFDDRPGRFMVDIRVTCTLCGTPLRWRGLPVGVDLSGATTSLDGQELCIAAYAGELAEVPAPPVLVHLAGAPHEVVTRQIVQACVGCGHKLSVYDLDNPPAMQLNPDGSTPEWSWWPEASSVATAGGVTYVVTGRSLEGAERACTS